MVCASSNVPNDDTFAHRDGISVYKRLDQGGLEHIHIVTMAELKARIRSPGVHAPYVAHCTAEALITVSSSCNANDLRRQQWNADGCMQAGKVGHVVWVAAAAPAKATMLSMTACVYSTLRGEE